jgi:hypothetical protein
MERIACIKSSAKRIIVVILALAVCAEILTLTYGVVFLERTEIPTLLASFIFVQLMIIGGYIGVSWWKEDIPKEAP